ncbi:MAG TPA: hypothetical protein VJP79_12025 [Nitrososphaera sp.]|nr:hypothetical protein [Nitrososphaera sp.]
MAERPAVTSDGEETHSFVKLAIAYLGLMAGLSILGLGFYVAAARVVSAGDPPAVAAIYNETMVFYLALFSISIAGLARLLKKKQDGAYFAFTSLILSLFAPSPSQIMRAPYTLIWWLAVPNTIVGILLLRAIKTLH